jgi:hypothetical protein
VPTSIAPLISGWQRRVGSRPGPYSVAHASGEASGGYGPNGLLVELLVDGSWVDITPRVMTRDSNGQISITRGQTAEGQQPSPGSCQFQLNNRDGLFSPANPLSPYYGKIGRNTQVRVSVTKGDDKSYRFRGEISAWPEDWDLSGQDVWVDIEAAGVLRRLNQGSTPLRSTMYRGLTSTATTTPVAYWPCEDGASSTSLASALGDSAMRIVGSPTLASDTGFLCAAALPVMAGGSLVGSIPPYTATSETQIRFLMYLPTAPPDGTQLIKAQAVGGTIPCWAITYSAGGGLQLKGLDSDGITALVASGAIAFGVDNKRVRVSLELTQSGSSVSWALATMDTTGSALASTGTFASQTVGRLTTLTVTPGQTVTSGVFGHISVQNDVTPIGDLTGAMKAYVGETVNDRFIRLCTEEGVNSVNIGPHSSDRMGPQLPNTFMALLQECIDVDQGILLEREVAFGLAYTARAAIYNQSSLLTLSYSGHQLSAPPRPVPDDQLVRNQVVASRPSGSSFTAKLSAGALSVQDPPLGVGVYSDSPTLNVETDDDLEQHAWWRVAVGTVDEPRYPAISINLASPEMSGLRLRALNMLFGQRLTVQSPPARLGGDISQLVIGISETITHFEHRLTFVCQPESPYEVVALNSATRGRLDSGSATLAGDLTPAQTSVQIATVGALLSTTDTPYDVLVAGEQITVTAVTGASSPQTATLTRAANGISKAHAAGESIHLATPVAVAL